MTNLSTERAVRPTLDYPFGMRWSPTFGSPFKVVEGVYWLRVPLPIDLDHINLWLLKDGDQWVIVDSGFDAPICKATWQTVFESFLREQTVSKIIITHFHPDHIGLASWLSLHFGCSVLITQGEFRHYHSIVNRKPEDNRLQANSFVNEMGYPKAVAENFVQFMQSEDKPKSGRVQEEMCEFIEEADEIVIDNRVWRVVIGSGHSPEHACLYCPDLKLMISGDQAIPRISSNVSVYPSNRDQNPLSDWLDSCMKLRDTVPAQTLILPSHQEPFIGIAPRMQQLIDDHHAQLNRLRLALDEPHSTAQAREVLFTRELNPVEVLLATGETLANLNYLVHANEISMSLDDGGVARYRIL